MSLFSKLNKGALKGREGVTDALGISDFRTARDRERQSQAHYTAASNELDQA